MLKQAFLRAGLLALALFQAVLGVWALLFPRGFYDAFPASDYAWVAWLPPFNEHLIRDVGALSLAFAFILAGTAIMLHDNTTRLVLIGYEFFALPHFIFHATHLHSFPPPDAIAQTLGLGALVALPLALIALTFGRHSSDRSPRGSDR